MGSKSRKIILHGVILAALFMVPPAIAQESPPCMAYAYTVAEGENHYSMIFEDSFVFGNSLVVVGNCENTSVYVDSQLIASSPSDRLTTFIDSGVHTVTIENGGYNQSFENVTIIASGQLTQVINQLPNEYNPFSIPYTIDEINSIELWSGVGAILVSWFVVTSLLWRVIKAHSDNNYCMEVG